jgi:alpha-L-fucosidase 2
LGILSKASKRSSEDILSRHAVDFSRQFESVSLRIGKDSGACTDERLAALKKGKLDPSLAALIFQFGRYLMLSSSRPGSLPATLQGIWCDSMTPIWNCNYTLNVNLQMSYWPVETTSLPLCHEPLFDFLERLVERGRTTARRMYGCRGFVAHHTSDMWADPAPTGGVYASALWPFGGAWLALHAWEHYLFGCDREFLRSKAYPILREAGLFFEDYLVGNSRGQLVAAPSVSPENWFVLPNGDRGKLCAGAAMDAQILRCLFEALRQASEVLGVDRKKRDLWSQILERLPKAEIDSSGRIREWVEPHGELDPGHRHLSHLFGVFPGSQISPLDGDGSLAKAAKKGLQVKLKAATDLTGWNQAWMANMFARLLDGEAAWECLQRIQKNFTHDSLLGDCPPLNLDGNFGFTSAVAEMLVQSHRGEIHLLPALPMAWPDGEVSGLRARGGFTISIAWKKGKPARVEIASSGERFFRLRCASKLEGRGLIETPAEDRHGFVHRMEIPAEGILVLKPSRR